MSAHPTALCTNAELVYGLAIGALTSDEEAAAKAHVAGCAECRSELEALNPIVDSFVAWPTDVVRPAPASGLWDRIARRIADESGTQPLPEAHDYREPQWEQVAPGIQCKLLATDADRARVSMLVRLAPDVSYPPHQHAGVEELHLLEGELWIEDRKLLPGDYNRGEPGTADKRVYSETGCTCVLITSACDRLG